MQNGRLTYSRENTNGGRNGEEQRKYLHSYKYSICLETELGVLLMVLMMVLLMMIMSICEHESYIYMCKLIYMYMSMLMIKR